MVRIFCTLAWLIVFAGIGFSQKEVVGIPEDAVVRLSPDDFPRLPHAVRSYLKQNKFTIPQHCESATKSNVVSGRFRNRKQIDWAVVASRHGMSSILIFWNGQTDSITTLAESEDRRLLIDCDGTKPKYSWSVGVVDKKFILEHYKWYGGPKPPPILHDAVNVGLGMVSTVHYLDGRRWHELTGAD